MTTTPSGLTDFRGASWGDPVVPLVIHSAPREWLVLPATPVTALAGHAMDDFKTQLAYFRSLSAEELARPLWDVPWDQRKAFLSARLIRQYHSDFDLPEAHERITDWADTE